MSQLGAFLVITFPTHPLSVAVASERICSLLALGAKHANEQCQARMISLHKNTGKSPSVERSCQSWAVGRPHVQSLPPFAGLQAWYPTSEAPLRVRSRAQQLPWQLGSLRQPERPHWLTAVAVEAGWLCPATFLPCARLDRCPPDPEAGALGCVLPHLTAAWNWPDSGVNCNLPWGHLRVSVSPANSSR